MAAKTHEQNYNQSGIIKNPSKFKMADKNQVKTLLLLEKSQFPPSYIIQFAFVLSHFYLSMLACYFSLGFHTIKFKF